MKILFALFLIAHGLIHLMGTAKAMGGRIDRSVGLLWLLAAALLIATAISLFTWPRWWWVVGAAAVVVSQVAIVTSWPDARYGTIANVIILLGVTLGFLSQGPWSLRAEFDREIERGLGRATPAPLLTDADLAGLPAVVQRYIRLNGAVGQPRVRNFRARFHGQIRSGPDARWMSFTGEQYNFYDQPSRLFLMDASMFGLPVQAFHRFVGPSATMRVKVASAVTMVDAKGPEMDAAETVTLFNDLCVFAPGVLVDRGIQWREIDRQTVSASYTNGSHTAHAVLSFNDRGELTNFVADGRGALSADGRSFTKMRWSTPLSDYRDFGSHRVMARGEGIWHPPAGDYAYLRFDLDAIEYNVAAPRSTRLSYGVRRPGRGRRWMQPTS
ncbi:MAG TPA: DUF6544 family protein [Gemmatimonadales bacterium]|nr:DUF6544 family protein [Gemmatimonadales bacterium]